MKLVSLLIACLMLSVNAFASERPNKKLAIEYLEIARFEQITNTTIDTYSRDLFKEMPKEDQAKFNKLLNDIVGWEATKNQLAEIVLKVYTKQELTAAIAYMKSKLGASMTAKSEEFSNLYSAGIANNFKKFIQEHPIPPNPAVNPEATR